MPCGPNCACEPGIECLSVLDPEGFGYFRDWCESGDEAKRLHVRNRSRLGLNPVVVAVAAAAPTPPGLAAQAVNFGKALVTHAIAGLPRVDEETYEARLATCQGCPLFDAGRIVCLSCGCHLDVKLWWAEQACPLGKWSRAEAVAETVA